MKNSFVIEYLNENEFRKKERAVKKYNMLAYKKLVFDFYPAFRDGNFMGVIVSKNTKDGIIKYGLYPAEIRNSIYIPVASFITSYARKKTITTSQIIKDYSIKKYKKDLI